MAVKKEKPTPVPCICGRQPVVAKGKSAGSWSVSCPAIISCKQAPMTRQHLSEDQAVKAWNTFINSLSSEEVQK